ncbi:MAG: transglutaminase-like domain-containing protein [Lachnospiraceae bacterium]
MFLEKSKSRIEAEFAKRAAEVPAVKEAEKEIETYRPEVALALKFLYTTMPLSDVGNYGVSSFLDYAEHGVFLWENSPYVKKMPEEIFLNYILYHRINTEEILDCRSIFYEDLKDRIQGKSMAEAAIEINYWCAEKATYHTTDNRTIAPINVYRCGNGRCGEESTFTISALRSAGIPARQVYAPFWSHCDDNHAWVELWCDGKWYFTGACEPEPILNKGWFTNASSRAMMVHSRWFDKIVPENEDVNGIEGNAMVLNQLRRYADVKEVSIRLKKPDGTPAAGTRLSLEVFNYSQFLPIAHMVTDEKGEIHVTTGKGSLHITVMQDGLWAEGAIDTRKEDILELTLKEFAIPEGWQNFDSIAPIDTPVNTDQPTEEQKEERDRRLAEALKIRTAKVEAFIPDWKVDFVDKAGENKEVCEKLMSVLTDKDRIDAKPAVLKSHVDAALHLKDAYPENIYYSYVLNPRVFNEVMTDYRGAIAAAFTEEEKAAFREDPKAIWSWIEENIKVCPEAEQESVYFVPTASLKIRKSSELSRHILFVAIARTLGVPARLNPMDGAMEYLMPDSVKQGAEAYENSKFQAVIAGKAKEARLVFTDGGLSWTYNQNWSIARLEKDGYLPLELEDLSWENGKLAIEADPGIYRILTGNRLPNGNVFGKSLTFSVEKGEEKTVELSSREAKLNDMLEDIAILPFNLLEKDGTKVLAADVTRGGRKILFWLEVSKEPTEHILNELMEKKEAFEKYKENLLFIIKKEEDLNDPTLSRCRAALPGIPVLYDTFTENINTLGRRMYVDPEKLPLILVTSGELNGIYATSGYNVGTADMLLRILEM